MRIHAISDLHTDFAANLLIIEGLSKSAYRDDALLVAGDIGDRLETISHTLAVLRERFAKVFYVPGNHELWVRADTTATDSLEKLDRIIELCVGLDVHTTPGRAGRLWIVPLLSWYEAEFDSGNEYESSLKAWADFYFCKWPKSIGSVCDHFTKLNASRIRRYDDKVISLSHFLPRRDLLPQTELLRFKGLPQVAGCEHLETQIRELGSIAHVFGHSHINCDRVINGVRYVQNALRYPSERGSRPFSLKTVWPLDDVEQGAENSTGMIQSV